MKRKRFVTIKGNLDRAHIGSNIFAIPDQLQHCLTH